jgi:glycosyltransferase involved in cell wall biosynthesis
VKRRCNVLLSAYACRPHLGSEPGVGWNLARELAHHHDIWVLTRSNNRPALEAELQSHPVPGLQVIYYDLPYLLRWWNRGLRGVQLHYYLWQLGAYWEVRRLQEQISFDLVHHVTYVKYWSPSFLALLPIPFLWGPVGGGESAPKPFWQDFNQRGKIYETSRNLARWLGERDPFLRATARRSRVAWATTEDTAQCLSALGAPQVEVLSQLGLTRAELNQLGQCPPPQISTVRFISIGRLLHWKGFHLGLKAFAQANLPQAEYWIVGSGPERSRLEQLAQGLGVGERVRFWGNLTREETLQRLGECLALVHPSLHESGGFVCLEALAARRPVLCLDLGGPAIQVTDQTGFRIPAESPEQVVHDLGKAMVELATHPELCQQMGNAGQERASQLYGWDVKSQQFAQLYETIVTQA